MKTEIYVFMAEPINTTRTRGKFENVRFKPATSAS